MKFAESQKLENHRNEVVIKFVKTQNLITEYKKLQQNLAKFAKSQNLWNENFFRITKFAGSQNF